MKKLATKTQKKNFIIGLNWLPLILEVSNKGKASKINKEANIAITPSQENLSAREDGSSGF